VAARLYLQIGIKVSSPMCIVCFRVLSHGSWAIVSRYEKIYPPLKVANPLPFFSLSGPTEMPSARILSTSAGIGSVFSQY
jgi:hypothetical protein